MKTSSFGFGSFASGPIPHVRTRYTKAEVQAIMRQGTNAIWGRAPDTYGFARVFWGAIAYSLFSSIHEAFLAKSNHGRDDLGFSWVDLTRKYKAYGRMDARRGIPLPGPKYRPTLKRNQNKRWKSIFARIWIKKGKDRQAAQIAAGAAWNYVKDKMGAITLIGETADRKVPLLQKTKRLINSLEPAPLLGDGRYAPINHDQIWRVQAGELTLGTRVPYAEFVDLKRPLWPRDISVWLDRAMSEGRDALIDRLIEILQSA